MSADSYGYQPQSNDPLENIVLFIMFAFLIVMVIAKVYMYVTK